MSFRRLAVVGGSESFGASEELLDKLRSHSLKPSDIGLPEEIEYGWSGGRHLFDGAFTFEHNVYGDYILFALRIDTNKAPGELKRAYIALEEEAAQAESPNGFLSKASKKDAKDAAVAKLEDELREGRHRRSKLVPLLWDTTRGTVYSSATGASLEKLRELFERTFGAELIPLSAGALALRHLEAVGKRRDYEDLRPTRFAYGPEGESQVAEYPWVSKGPEPKEFLGNEFLLWLWRETENNAGTIELSNKTDLTVMIDRSLDLDCTFGQTGRDALRGDGPTRMPEARDGLKSGKIPRKAGLVVDASGEQFALTFSAEGFAFSGLKLPEIEADNPRELIEARLEHMLNLTAAFDDAYAQFLSTRTSGKWEGYTADTRKWITVTAKQTPRLEVEIHNARATHRRPATEGV